jgi:quercetin dioxygenase-like cupin family protein
MSSEENNPDAPRSHVHVRDVQWTASPQYPEALRRVYRYKPLIGGRWPGVIPQQDVLMGVLELAPRAIYAAHAHPAPEIYYVMSGKALWTVGDETFDAEPGTAIYHAPNALHRMINTGDETLRVCWIWWAPDGNHDVLNIGSKLLEPVPEQPENAKFSSIDDI